MNWRVFSREKLSRNHFKYFYNKMSKVQNLESNWTLSINTGMQRASICKYGRTLKNSTKERHEARITSYGGAHPRL